MCSFSFASSGYRLVPSIHLSCFHQIESLHTSSSMAMRINYEIFFWPFSLHHLLLTVHISWVLNFKLAEHRVASYFRRFDKWSSVHVLLHSRDWKAQVRYGELLVPFAATSYYYRRLIVLSLKRFDMSACNLPLAAKYYKNVAANTTKADWKPEASVEIMDDYARLARHCIHEVVACTRHVVR